jgi:hypothetical protein
MEKIAQGTITERTAIAGQAVALAQRSIDCLIDIQQRDPVGRPAKRESTPTASSRRKKPGARQPEHDPGQM